MAKVATTAAVRVPENVMELDMDRLTELAQALTARREALTLELEVMADDLAQVGRAFQSRTQETMRGLGLEVSSPKRRGGGGGGTRMKLEDKVAGAIEAARKAMKASGTETFTIAQVKEHLPFSFANPTIFAQDMVEAKAWKDTGKKDGRSKLFKLA